MVHRTLFFWRQLTRWFSQPQAAGAVLAPGDDRRAWGRRPCDVEIVGRTTGDPDGGPFTARVRDISRGGIGLLTDRPFRPGEVLSLDLPAADGLATYTVLAYVLHAREAEGEGWHLGCHFARELAEADLRSFGAQRVRAAPPDQRGWVRFPCSARAHFQLETASRREQRPAKILNLSANGAGLLVEQPVEAGSLLTLDLQSTTESTARTLLACVVRVDPVTDDGWVLGCNFISELSEKEVQALL